MAERFFLLRLSIVGADEVVNGPGAVVSRSRPFGDLPAASGVSRHRWRDS